MEKGEKSNLVKDYLKEKGISFREFKHPAVFTCDGAERYTKEIKGIHSKNLFLKNKNSDKFYLAILPADKKLDINKLNDLILEKLKFANENDLKKVLNLSIGAVSPFGLIDDKEHKTIVLIDKEVWSSDFVSFHPNINTETLELKGEDFHKYLKSLRNEIKII